MSDRRISRLLTAGMSVAVLLVAGLQSSPAQACPGGSEPLLGSMCVVAFNFAPRGYSLAQGQIVAINSNQALFSLLGTTYGGDGRTTFGLPDTRGRSVIGAGQGPGLSDYRLGSKGGAETHTLSTAQMPTHTHTATTTATAHANSAGNKTNPAGNVWAQKRRTNIYSDQAPDVEMNTGAISATTAIGNAGGNQAFGIRAPYLAVHWIIAMQGVFPSRN